MAARPESRTSAARPANAAHELTHPEPARADAACDEFIRRWRESLAAGTFVKATLGKPRRGDCRNQFVRRVKLKDGERLSFVERFATRDETHNFPFEAGLARAQQLLGPTFGSGHLLTTTNTVQLEFNRRGEGRLSVTAAAHAAAPTTHDRARNRLIDPATAPYLRALGVTDAHGKIRERMGDKFRQIERYVELLAQAVAASPVAARSEFTLVDMGAGKGYLTFAAYDYLTRLAGKALKAVGVEARGELAASCNTVAHDAGFAGLSFVASTIAEFSMPSADIVVALHACDTATDDALAAAVTARVPLILASPCCHKELRPQLQAAPALRDVLRHGVFADRQAEMATDALRVLLLEQAGYRTQVMEFVASEHTPRNVLLVAHRRERPLDAAAAADVAERIDTLKRFYGVSHQRLGDLLAARPPAPRSE